MIKYECERGNFDEEGDKVVKDMERFKEGGEWKNEDLGRGGGNNCVEVSVKGGNRSGMKDRVKGVEKMMT
ncbi:hypothetical protein, partial [Staphylococcus epidermidis]|uniref:hypothetical protein n=1 Tax=Staphylococcus epidermidis TaxID=1282 RepID=UPI00119EA3D4